MVNSIKTLSEALQDTFAYKVCGLGSSYIEVGAAFPKQSSTTYVLETEYKWKGISLEKNHFYLPLWQDCQERRNTCYFTDALSFDYAAALEQNNISTHVGYVSCDIDPPGNTFEALKRIVNQGISFNCITYEHDRYCSDEDFDYLSREFLLANGYKVAVTDVYPLQFPSSVFETWYVKNEINFTKMSFEEYIRWVLSGTA
jgi:hypothetical protein